MTNITINELKTNFNKWAELAAKGELIQVTKYSKPYVALTAPQAMHFGKLVGKKNLQPLLKDRSLSSRANKILTEDRNGG